MHQRHHALINHSCGRHTLVQITNAPVALRSVPHSFSLPFFHVLGLLHVFTIITFIMLLHAPDNDLLNDARAPLLFVNSNLTFPHHLFIVLLHHPRSQRLMRPLRSWRQWA